MEIHYSRLPKPEVRKVNKKLGLLQAEPLAGKKLSGELSGLRTLRAWPYRIVYGLDENKNQIVIHSILHRRGAYK